MAYVLWRVLMKKYSKVRMGIRRHPVIPADSRVPEKDETWNLATERYQDDRCNPTLDVAAGEPSNDDATDKILADDSESELPVSTVTETNLQRVQETRKSKTKRVKSYLKKCKGALTSGKNEESTSSVGRRETNENCTSWYVSEDCTASAPATDTQRERVPIHGLNDNVEDTENHETTENPIPTLNQSDREIYTKNVDPDNDDRVICYSPDPSNLTDRHDVNCEINTITDIRSGYDPSSIEDLRLLDKCDSSDTLIAESPESIVVPSIDRRSELRHGDNNDDADDNIAGGLSTALTGTGRAGVASLVRTHLGPIYGDDLLDLLTRQARDILVCDYHGNLENFFESYLSPAAALLERLNTAALDKKNESTIPDGWPLTLAGKGLVVQLGELEASTLRHGECYLCVRKTPNHHHHHRHRRRRRCRRIIGCRNDSLTEEEDNRGPLIGDNAPRGHILEIALVWRSSMRSPGFLGWDREDELMDRRDPTRKSIAERGSTSGPRPDRETTLSAGNRGTVRERTETKSRLRRRSREESGRCRLAVSGKDPVVGVDSANDRWKNSELGARYPNEDAAISSKTTDYEIRMSRDRSENEKIGDSSGTSDSSFRRDGQSSSRRLNIEHLESPASLVKVINGKYVDGCDGGAGSTTIYRWTKSSSSSSGSSSGFHSITSGATDSETSTNCDYSQTPAETSSSSSSSLPRHDINYDDDDDDYDENDQRLTDLIESLLVTVQRKIERVNIEDLVFPCPSCRNIDTEDSLIGCKCAIERCDCSIIVGQRCNCGIPTANSDSTINQSRSFEVAGIKHIDSDDEEEVAMGFGSKRRAERVSAPRSIHDLSDDILNCGLKLPGYTDSTGRPVLEFEPDSASRREMLCPREVAAYILYLVRLRGKERTKDDWTLLVNGGSTEDLEILDRALVLLGQKFNVCRVLVLRSARTEGLTEPQFPKSRIKTLNVDDVTIDQHIPRRRDESHDQSRWIAFYKEYDSLMIEWQAAGRRLALEMSELKDGSNAAGSLTPLSHLLVESTLKRTSRDATETITNIEHKAAACSLRNLSYVGLSLARARRLVAEVENATTRLEASLESRRATIKNLAMLRSIEDQAREVLNWLCKKGEETLAKHSQHAATTLTAARLDEREFEKFYFTSMRHLDKGNDLAEAATASGLRELARSLKQHLRGFGSRLEERREYLEDTSRCCLLQDRAYEWAHEARLAGERRSQQFLMARPPLPAEHFTEMMGLAEKLGNDVLLDQCRIARNKCAEALELARTCSAPGSPARRRSFATSESATSWDDGCGKRTSWEDSDSNASYPCPMDGTGNTSSSNGSGRPTLDNIAELGETAEQLLDCSPSRTPPPSPAPRRLAKPPVNSHLHRAPSIAPGMKAKKTILLIMREMIQTERDYVKSLEYIIENYIPELVREDIPQALRGQRNVIFGNVEKIYEFHSQHFLRELEECEQCPMMVGQCFLRHEKKFYLYALYNKNKPNSDSLMAEYGTTFFKTKQLELVDKMDLASYLLKPVQRMGKYALLLQQLVKAGTDISDRLVRKDDKDEREDDGKPIVEGEADLRAAEQMVRFQLRHGNDLLAMDSLRDCDVNVKEQGRLLRQNEFLVWQGRGKKCLRQVFLFEDLILFSKARRFPDRKNLDIYIYKHSIKTTDIGLTAVIADCPTKFEIWFRKRKPGDTYTLQCASEDIKKAWTEELSNLLWKQALRNREVRLAEMSSMGIGNKPCLDIRPSADQINDRSISVAQLSKTPRFRNSIAVSISDDSGRCSRRPHSVISVSSSSSSGGSSGPSTTLNLGLDTSPRPHHRSTTLNSQCSVESGIIADISIVSDDGGDGIDRNNWKSTSRISTTSTPLQSPTIAKPTTSVGAESTSSSSDANLTPYDQDTSINL